MNRSRFVTDRTFFKYDSLLLLLLKKIIKTYHCRGWRQGETVSHSYWRNLWALIFWSVHIINALVNRARHGNCRQTRFSNIIIHVIVLIENDYNTTTLAVIRVSRYPIHVHISYIYISYDYFVKKCFAK